MRTNDGSGRRPPRGSGESPSSSLCRRRPRRSRVSRGHDERLGERRGVPDGADAIGAARPAPASPEVAARAQGVWSPACFSHRLASAFPHGRRGRRHWRRATCSSSPTRTVAPGLAEPATLERARLRPPARTISSASRGTIGRRGEQQPAPGSAGSSLASFSARRRPAVFPSNPGGRARPRSRCSTDSASKLSPRQIREASARISRPALGGRVVASRASNA
jgi:hypothetical protein